jgi:hypothetical protein
LIQAVPAEISTVAQEEAPQVEDNLGTGLGPEHAGLLEALTDDGFTTGLDGTGTAKEAAVVEGHSHPITTRWAASALPAP